MIRVVDVHAGDGTDGDPSMILDVEMSQHYHHSLGTASRFFTGLGDAALFATRCDTCDATFFPPRQYCSVDLGSTSWYELPGTGSVVAASVVHSPPPFGGIDAPYVLASIQLDGVDGGLTHRILGSTAPLSGSKVSVRFLDAPHAHPLLGIAFETHQQEETS